MAVIGDLLAGAGIRQRVVLSVVRVPPFIPPLAADRA